MSTNRMTEADLRITSTRIALREDSKRKAVYSRSRLHRLFMRTEWGSGLNCHVVLLNCSSATEDNNDKTNHKLEGVVRDWCVGGKQSDRCFGSLTVTNLYTFRATTPKDMMDYYRSVDAMKISHMFSCNREIIVESTKESHFTFLAWGNGGSFLGEGQEIIDLLKPYDCVSVVAPYRKIRVLAFNDKSGAPAHPLYLAIPPFNKTLPAYRKEKYRGKNNT